MPTYSSPLRDPHDLQNYGPRLEIEVGLPIVGTSRKSHVTSKMPGLIDTGAARTLLSPEAVAKLALPLVDRRIVTRVGGTNEVGLHVASVRFPNSKLARIDVMQVLCCALPEQPVQCLIGRDILSRWLFTYDGKLGAWSINEESTAPWIEPDEEGLWK